MSSAAAAASNATALTADDAIYGDVLGRMVRIAPRPTSVAQTGLPLTLLEELAGKHLLTSGVLTLSQIIGRLALSGPIVEQILNGLRADGRIEVRARPSQSAELRYGLTEKGRAAAQEALSRGGYVGPAPVPLAAYAAVVAQQNVRKERITQALLRRTFEGMVIADELLDLLGPAMNSQRAIFLYGAPGTGKTYTARRMARALSGLVLIPHAIAVNDAIVEVFDPICHLPTEFSSPPSPTALDQGFDLRFVPCERPVVLTGGELSAEMLEIQFDPKSMRNLAPLQLKANNGFLLIDDLGRQRIDPLTLFNRWIVPMESQRDSLIVGSGRHFEVPFDVVLVFSTNLTPARIADEAFLRRLGYKIEFTPIDARAYRAIWAETARRIALVVDPRLVDVAINELHRQQGIPMLPCHPRDLLSMAAEHADYVGKKSVDKDSLGWAWRSYFVPGERNRDEPGPKRD